MIIFMMKRWLLMRNKKRREEIETKRESGSASDEKTNRGAGKKGCPTTQKERERPGHDLKKRRRRKWSWAK